MMSESQEQVRNLFNLNREEKILDDFGCSLSETIPIPGRLYLTEHYICFGSNLFGFNRKYSIAFTEITELLLKKANIEIKSKNNKFSFTSFNNIQIVYRRIKSMCRSYNETISTSSSDSKGKEEINPILLSDSENSDDEEDDIKTNITYSSSKKDSLNSNSNTSSNDNSPKTNDSEGFFSSFSIVSINRSISGWLIFSTFSYIDCFSSPSFLSADLINSHFHR